MPPRAQRRRQQRTGEDRAQVRLTIDGEEYLFDTAQVSHRHELALWQQARLTMLECFKALGDEKPALFLIAAIVYLARVSNGEKVTYDEVAEALTLSSDIDVHIVGDDDEEDDDEDGDQGGALELPGVEGTSSAPEARAAD
jgi:hypothetical protein